MPQPDAQAPSQITGYSFQPYIDLTPEEVSKLSAMTRNAKNIIYLHGFLANTQKNKNGWRITDNKYIEQNSGIVTGRPIIFGPRVKGLAHHPQFYNDLKLTGDATQDKEQFIKYQNTARIGDMFRMKYNKDEDRWEFNGAISHPDIVEAIQKKELELPKFVSPYFWNENDPDDTGDEIREAELFHTAFVDDPAYGPEVARIYQYCDPSTEGTACIAKVMGMGASIIEQARRVSTEKPLCACGLMASYTNKLDSSFYVENPKAEQTQIMTEESPPQPHQDNNNANTNTSKTKDQIAQDAALKLMQQYDKEANKANNTRETGAKKGDEDTDPNNPTIPVQYQDALNLAIERDREEQHKGFSKTIKEKDETIATLQAEIQKYVEKGREAILDSYIDKETFKDEKEYKTRRDFYAKLATDLKMSNEQLEELMKGHYQVQEVKYMKNKKGQGAGVVINSNANMDPFGFNNREQSAFGKLTTSSTSKKGLAASSNPDQDDDADFDDDNDNGNNGNTANAIVNAFS